MQTAMNRSLQVVLAASLLCSLACKSSSESSSTPPAPAAPKASALVLKVAYGSEKKTWLEEQARAFSQTAKTASGRPIRVEGAAMGSGEATQAILSGQARPHVFSPASGAYVSLLNQGWLSQAGHTAPLSPAGEPLVLSPIVIAMWRPMAEALGWPGKALGWRDLLKVAADPKGWGAYDHAEWGRFKLGHTHPESSNSGLLAVLAEAYAGAKKLRGLEARDLEAKATQDLLGKVEGTLVHYGKSTGFFADKMLARGPGYLSAAVLYENLVIESYGKPNPSNTPIVAVYPVEGTFWSDHPYAVLDAPWVGPEEREAAQAFLAFLKARPAQQRALELGFRPGDPSIAIGAPIDAAHGVDPKQPQTLLEVPGAAVLQRLIEVWRAKKRPTDVTLVFDKSGSMNGKPLEQAKAGARAFLSTLTDRDTVSLLFFDARLYPVIGPLPLATGRAELLSRIDGVIADGGTSLYDASAQAHAAAEERARKDPSRIYGLLVMTDGKDNHSKVTLDGLKAKFAEEDSAVKVFTIAYGDEADPKLLGDLAEAAKGSFAKGSSADIVGVFQDMASFF